MNSVAVDLAMDVLLDHARSSMWRGEVISATHLGRVRNPVCGDEVSLQMRVVAGKIQEIRFQGRGCFLSQATASLLCERLTGQDWESFWTLDSNQLLGFDSQKFSMLRQRCCLLAVEALHQCHRASSQSV